MQHVVQFCSIGLLVLALGCVSGGNLDGSSSAADRAANRLRISNARTWAFLKSDPTVDRLSRGATAGSTYRVTSPLRNAAALDAEVARYIEDVLGALGFAQVEHEADIYVNYTLVLQPHAQFVEDNFSQRFLASFSYSPSYIIESSEITRRNYEDLDLAIDLREPRGRTLWRRELKLRLKAFDPLALRERVEDLLAPLPHCSAQ